MGFELEALLPTTVIPAWPGLGQYGGEALDDAKNTDSIFIGSPRGTPRGKQGNSERTPCATACLHCDGRQRSNHRGLCGGGLGTRNQSGAFGTGPRGTTTIGTQAVVELVTCENYLNGLLQRMKVSGPSDVRPFEAAIQVKVARGVPVESSRW